MLRDFVKNSLAEWSAPHSYYGTSIGEDIDYLQEILEDEPDLDEHEKDIINLCIYHLKETQGLIRLLLKRKGDPIQDESK